jgi:hypothetical protein
MVELSTGQFSTYPQLRKGSVKSPGLNPTNKRRENFFCILSKFSVFCNFPQNIQIEFLWKIYRNLTSQQHQKPIQKNFLFYRKNLSVWNFLCKQKTGFFSAFADGRIKPRCLIHNAHLWKSPKFWKFLVLKSIYKKNIFD